MTNFKITYSDGKQLRIQCSTEKQARYQAKLSRSQFEILRVEEIKT